MYSECVSLADSILSQSSSEENVLRSFPSAVGREVVGPVIRSLQELVLGKSIGDTDPLSLPEHVQWVMQTVGYGLTLPLSELSLLQGCVDVYQDWLSSLYFQKSTVPLPIRQDPNHYAQIIFSQLSSLFVPREGEPRLLEDHAFLCKKVIDIVRSLMVVKGLIMNRDTWASVFEFLLHICDLLLSPPSQSPSLGTSLCESLIRVLFSAWLRACKDTFPVPNLWKTLREFCCRWRHHPQLIQQWSEVMFSLSAHLVSYLYGSKHLSFLRQQNSSLFGSAQFSGSDFNPLIKDLDYSITVQAWFRLLHTLGNLVDLLHPDVITGTPSFRRALGGSSVGASPLTPSVQSCVDMLPFIFEEAMSALLKQVTIFIGQDSSLNANAKGGKGGKPLGLSAALKPGSVGFRSPSVRRKETSTALSKSTFYTPSPVQTPPSKGGEKEAEKGGGGGVSEPFYINLSPDPASPPFSALDLAASGGSGTSRGRTTGSLPRKDEGMIGKPRGNSLLHIFGVWLFEAAAWTGKDRNGLSLISKRPTSSVADIQELMKLHQRIKDYEAGRAEAISCLCHIFSQLPCGEDVLRVYLSRFYHCLSVCLTYDSQVCTGQVLTRTILGSVSLLRKDLIGFNILIPQYLSSIENILPVHVDEVKFRCDVPVNKLRRASIQILLSMLPLPLHYIHLKIPDLVTLLDSVRTVQSLSDSGDTFYSLKNRVIKLMFAAMETEKDPVNMQMLLHGFNILIHDIFIYESSVSKMMSGGGGGGEEKEDQADCVGGTEKPSDALSLNTLFHQACLSAHFALQNWSNDNIVTLAALELLSDLARLQFDALSHVGCRDAVQWVCEFIESQSQQKPFLQTKSLHTSIVAGFITLIIWIMEHPHLLAHEFCLASILRVTEFGITGTFSKSETGVILKGDKELRPISGRVGEMAEFLLYCIMEKFGSFPSPCGPAAGGSLLTEEELIKQLITNNTKSPPTTIPKFRYFLIDNSLILGLLEGSFSEEEGTLPTVTGVIRGPSSRQVWTVQLRHHPRSHNPSTLHLKSQPRPTPLATSPSCPNLVRPPWPDGGKINGLKLSGSIPNLDEIIDESSKPLHREFSQLTNNQIGVESNIQSQLKRLQDQTPFPNPARALEPPEVKKNLDTARLFLSHLGLLNMDHLQGLPGQPSLSLLDSSSLSFRSSLGSLDRMPTRYCDTVFVMYCSKGQAKPEEILRTQLPLQNKSGEYIQFLHGLGWIVDPFRHPGFTGKLRPETSEDGGSSHGILNAQIPLRPFPYYADAITEIAFVTPTHYTSANESVSSVRSVESSDSGPDSSSVSGDPLSLPPSSLLAPQPLPSWSAPSGSGVSKSQVTAGEGGGVGLSRPMRASTSQSSAGTTLTAESADTPRRRVQPPRDCAVLVVWLEVFEDHLSFPLVPMSKLLYRVGGPGGKSEPSLPVLFIHKMRSGLYQISAKTGSSPGGPLIDGMVVSSRCLSTLVRQTVINICARHRMENEGYSPPHIKRKRKIEEMSAHFGQRLTPAGLYSELITTTTVNVESSSQ